MLLPSSFEVLFPSEWAGVGKKPGGNTARTGWLTPAGQRAVPHYKMSPSATESRGGRLSSKTAATQGISLLAGGGECLAITLFSSSFPLLLNSLSAHEFSHVCSSYFPPPRPLGKREGRQAAVWVLSSWPCCTPTAHLEATPRALFTTPLSPAAHLDITSPPRRSVFQLFKST